MNREKIRLVANILGISLTGSLVGFFQQWVADSKEYRLGRLVYCIALAILSYYLVHLIITKVKSGKHSGGGYVLIGILGSIVFYLYIHLADEISHAWRFTYTRTDQSSIQYVLHNAQDLITQLSISSIITSFIAVPTLLLFYYTSKLVVRFFGEETSGE